MGGCMGSLVQKAVGITALIMILLSPSLFAQGPEISWSRYYGGFDDELGFCVEQTSDDGFILAGATSSYGFGHFEVPDAYFIKVNSNGDTLWTRTFGSPTEDDCFSIKQMPDGGYIAAIWGFADLMKLDTDGDSVWSRSYGCFSTHVELTRDGGFILSSMKDGCFALTRVDSSGNQVWQHSYSYGTSSGLARSVKQLADSGFIAVGVNYTPDPNYSDCYLVRTDSQGDTIWTRSFNLPVRNYEVGYDVCQTIDGGFIVLLHDFWVIKTDTNGNEEWRQFCGGNTGESAYSLSPMPDGTYLLGGTGSDFYAGYFMSKIDINGDTLWTGSYGGSFCWGLTARPTRDGGFVMIGYGFHSEREDSDIRLIKFSQITGLNDETYSMPNAISLMQNEPNPFNASTLIRYNLTALSNVKLNIYNISGQLVTTLLDGIKSPGSHGVIWHTEDISSGIYFAQLESDRQKQSIKMVLLK